MVLKTRVNINSVKTVNSPGFPPEKENTECERDSKKRKSSYCQH